MPEGFVDFYKVIESWQNEIFFKLKRNTIDNETVAEDFLRHLTRPVIETYQFDVDSEDYKETFLELAQLIKDQRPSIADKIDMVVDVFSQLDFGEIVRAVVDQDGNYFDDVISQRELPGELALFMVDHSLRPYLRNFAFPFQETIANTDITWDNGVCPVCGFRSNLSWVRGQDGIRFLFCEHCFTEWQAKYLGCTYCGNTEPGSVKYLVIDGDEAHQIFVCGKCRGYLKTLDERKGLVDEGLFIAGIETVYLDLIAEEEGYTRDADIDRNLN